MTKEELYKELEIIREQKIEQARCERYEQYEELRVQERNIFEQFAEFEIPMMKQKNCLD